MPTWAITDDTKSIAIAQDGIVVKNIDKDIVVLRIIPANTGLNTTTTDVLSIEHDGEYATRIPYNDVTVSGVSPSSADDFRTKVLTILNNNSSGGSSASITVNQSVAVQMEGATSGQTYPVENQWYIIQNISITGVDQIRTIGVIDQTTGNGIFSKNAEAYVTALSTYVPCTYDVGTNTISGDYVVYAANLSQASTGAPTVDLELKNLMGETPTFTHEGSGEYRLNTSTFIFPEFKTRPYYNLIGSGSGSIFSARTVYVNRSTDNRMIIYTGIIADSSSDDLLDNTYIEIKINF